MNPQTVNPPEQIKFVVLHDRVGKFTIGQVVSKAELLSINSDPDWLLQKKAIRYATNLEWNEKLIDLKKVPRNSVQHDMNAIRAENEHLRGQISKLERAISESRPAAAPDGTAHPAVQAMLKEHIARGDQLLLELKNASERRDALQSQVLDQGEQIRELREQVRQRDARIETMLASHETQATQPAPQALPQAPAAVADPAPAKRKKKEQRQPEMAAV